MHRAVRPVVMACVGVCVASLFAVLSLQASGAIVMAVMMATGVSQMCLYTADELHKEGRMVQAAHGCHQPSPSRS